MEQTKVKPLFIKGDIAVYSENDYNRIHRELADENAILRSRGQEEKTLNGTSFVDENILFKNYFRKNEDETIEVVFEPLSIEARDTNTVLMRSVLTHKVDKHGRLVGNSAVSFNEFVTEFPKSLSKKEALLVYAQVNNLQLP